MATYRQIYNTIWQDEYIMELSTEEKLLFIYLISNPRTTQCGIYQISNKIIEFETGLEKEQIYIILKKFINDNKIMYSETTKEIYIVNWLKYHFVESPKIINYVKKELHNVKNKEFIKLYIQTAKELGMKEENIKILYEVLPDETSHNPHIHEENKKENIPEKFYQENFGLITPFIAESIQHYIDMGVQDELIIETMKQAKKRNAKWNYAEAILKNCISENIKTFEQYQAKLIEYEDIKNNKRKTNNKDELLLKMKDWTKQIAKEGS